MASGKKGSAICKANPQVEASSVAQWAARRTTHTHTHTTLNKSFVPVSERNPPGSSAREYAILYARWKGEERRKKGGKCIVNNTVAGYCKPSSTP